MTARPEPPDRDAAPDEDGAGAGADAQMLDAQIDAHRNDPDFMGRLRELHETEAALFKRLAG